MNNNLVISLLVVLMGQFMAASALTCNNFPGVTFISCGSGGHGGKPPPTKHINSCEDETYEGGSAHAYKLTDKTVGEEFTLVITAITFDADYRILLKRFNCPGCYQAVIGPEGELPLSIPMNNKRFIFSSKSEHVSVTFHIENDCEPEPECSVNTDKECQLALEGLGCVMIDKTNAYLARNDAASHCVSHYDAQLMTHRFTRDMIKTIRDGCDMPLLDQGETSLWVGNMLDPMTQEYNIQKDAWAGIQPDWTAYCVLLVNMNDEGPGNGGFGFHDVPCSRDSVGEKFYQKGGYALCLKPTE